MFGLGRQAGWMAGRQRGVEDGTNRERTDMGIRGRQGPGSTAGRRQWNGGLGGDLSLGHVG